MLLTRHRSRLICARLADNIRHRHSPQARVSVIGGDRQDGAAAELQASSRADLYLIICLALTHIHRTVRHSLATTWQDLTSVLLVSYHHARCTTRESTDELHPPPTPLVYYLQPASCEATWLFDALAISSYLDCSATAIGTAPQPVIST